MEQIPIQEIVLATGLNVRGIKDDLVKKYAEALGYVGDWGEPDCWPFPPLTIYRVDGRLLLADGKHRLKAAERNRYATVPCDVTDGEMSDAMLAAAAANGKHGEPLTAEERSTAVRMALTADATLSDRAVARMVGCSPTTVGRIRDLLEEVGIVEAPVFRVGGDGKKRQTKTIEEKAAELVEQIQTVGEKIEKQLSIMDSCREEQRQEAAHARATRPSPSEIERQRFRQIFLHSHQRQDLLSSLIKILEHSDLAFVASLIEDRLSS